MAIKRYDLINALNDPIVKQVLASFVQSKSNGYKSGKLVIVSDIVKNVITFEVQYATRIMHGHKSFTTLIAAVEWYNGL